MLDDDTWLTPEQVIRYGFVDEILFNDQTQIGLGLAGRSQVASNQTKDQR
ncbi:hypothetical protein [Bacillus atrophaeus]|nr:hypothetical protein [Bacillus atrophaeus]MCY9205220.1 hypothetical protein [Bacillus atrophaeus]MEC0883836.1 hypothetical protein [Bacillus atrophaeus]